MFAQLCMEAILFYERFYAWFLIIKGDLNGNEKNVCF